MSKVTSKLQVTLPKAIAEQYGIEAGDDVFFEPAGESIRLRVAPQEAVEQGDLAWKLRLFDQSTQRQRARDEAVAKRLGEATDRDWTRDDLYDRALPR